MSIRNLKDGSKKPWLCECYPNGRAGKRVRKKFATKGEAAAFERFTMKEIEDKPWTGDKPDHRRLTQLIELWFDHYGATLSNGPTIKSKFLKMAQAWVTQSLLRFLLRCIPSFVAAVCLANLSSLMHVGKKAHQVSQP